MDNITRLLMQGAAGAGDKTYVDDLFSTYLYSGNSTTLSVNNGVDNTKGGMIWFKPRTETERHMLFDTERGTTNYIQSNDNAAQTSGGAALTSFDDDGYTLGASAYQNNSGRDYASWNFRKEKGFFDIVTYTGNGSNRTISHSLGCVPGMIIVKRTDVNSSWMVYHRNAGGSTGNPGGWSYLFLEQTAGVANHITVWNDTDPTSSVFSVGTDTTVNANGGTYIAYIFAGGPSTAATARSVDFDGSDVAYTDNSSNYTLGTGDFTLEYWFKADTIPSSGNYSNLVDYSDNDWSTRIQPDGTHQYMSGGSARITSTTSLGKDQWHHIAIVRSSGTSRMYVNGVQEGGTYSDSTNYNFTLFYMGRRENGVNPYDGKISNLRLVVGTAVYTSSFRPPTEPLTNITNTKLLCFNSSSVTGTTVGTIEVSGNAGLLPTASTDSPFDDPEGFKFGEGGDQNIIKCGYYKTDSNEDATINLGWEPQWILVKRIDSSSGGPDWLIYDSFRGLNNAQDIKANSGGSKSLSPNLTSTESNNSRIGATSTGIYADQYGANRTYVYMAIRRPDGYVGKPAEAGTNAFAMDIANGSTDGPTYDSGFPVDFLMRRKPTGGNDDGSGGLNATFIAYERLLGLNYLRTATTDVQATSSRAKWDLMTGANHTDASPFQAWMWKRHAGFDVVAYKGTSTSYPSGIFQSIPHSLGKTPEMIWIKNRTAGNNWEVGHKGLDGGTNPWEHYIELNSTSDENGSLASGVNVIWGNGAPNATHFNVGDFGAVNSSSHDYIAMLFASVDGISKCGYYDGTGYTGHAITTGFTPRLLIIKNITNANSWFLYDSLRGLGAGNDPYLQMENTNAQAGGDTFAISSTGFTINQTYSSVNQSGSKYIYYAHA